MDAMSLNQAMAQDRGSMTEKLTKRGEPRRSTTGGPGKRNVDQTNWRVKLQKHRIKFDDDAKERFLDMFSKTSRVMMSADAAGISLQTVRDHIKNDPDFAEAYEEAKERYRDRCHEQADKLMFEGVDQPLLGGKDKDQIITYVTKYSEGLLQMELKRVDPSYKDRSEIEHKGGGGVLIAPAGMSPEDWIKAAEEENEHLTEPAKTV